MKLAAIFLPLVLASAPASAALSGFYDSAEQITAIISSSDVADAARQQPIDAITRTATRDDGVQEWTVKTHRCELKVHLKPVPPSGLGKTTYLLDVPGKCD